MSTYVDIDNPSSYKNCAKKQYEIYVCMPPKNTIVINKLEQADVVKQLGNKTYFTRDDIDKIQKTNPPLLSLLQSLVSQGRAYAVTDATPFVLCGTVGEMWTIKPDKLASTYMFLQNGQPLQINQQTLNQRMKNDVLDWTVVRTSPQATAGQNMACFVPSSQKGQIQTSWGSVLNLNGAGVSHGKGDFVVCEKLPNGQPNLSNRWVVNGEIFATTYNNQGWVQCLGTSAVKSINISSLPKLVMEHAKVGIDAIAYDNALSKSFLGAVNLSRIFKQIYSKVINGKNDSLSLRKELAKNAYYSYETGHGGASLVYTANHLAEILCGNQILEEKVALSQFISEIVKACQNKDSTSTVCPALFPP